MTTTLTELAKVIRSKNAKPFLITFDIIFDDVAKYRRVVDSGKISKAALCALYGIGEERFVSLYEFDAGLSIKFTIRRLAAQGSIGESDVYGCQQHAPLLDLVIDEAPVGIAE